MSDYNETDDDDTETDRAYEHWLDEKLGVIR